MICCTNCTFNVLLSSVVCFADIGQHLPRYCSKGEYQNGLNNVRTTAHDVMKLIMAVLYISRGKAIMFYRCILFFFFFSIQKVISKVTDRIPHGAGSRDVIVPVCRD